MIFLWSCFISWFAALCAASALIQGECIKKDLSLTWLAERVSDESAISCQGETLQLHNYNRYWGTQFGKNASVVVYPATTKDVSYAVRAANSSPLGDDFAFVGGAHSQTNSSSAYGYVIDLSWMNSSGVVNDFKVKDRTTTAILYEGGANWGQVQKALNGSGWTPVGARVSNVGVGGFSTGGGIGFLAGAHGYAIDRLLQLEVVLPDGKIVIATKHNCYSDLFWALQGGGGQFGIVTRFWQEAVPEPKTNTIGLYYINDDDADRLRKQTVHWFNENQDPYAVVYYSYGYLPAALVADPPPESYAKRILLLLLHFDDHENPDQLDFESTFSPLLTGLNTTNHQTISTKHYADLVFIGDGAYPYGYRRGFYGGQVSNITEEYLASLTNIFGNYIDDLLERGEKPYSASYVMQYMFPGLNGHLPASNADTAWPHAVAGHQTLFTPAYKNSTNDALTLNYLEKWNDINFREQEESGIFLANYPNYLSPQDSGHRVFGDNISRLERLKKRYDPSCLICNGKVFGKTF